MVSNLEFFISYDPVFYICFRGSVCLVEQAAMERQVELEHRAVESSTALARIQVMSALTVV